MQLLYAGKGCWNSLRPPVPPAAMTPFLLHHFQNHLITYCFDSFNGNQDGLLGPIRTG